MAPLLRVNVIAAAEKATIAALRTAAALVADLGGNLIGQFAVRLDF